MLNLSIPPAKSLAFMAIGSFIFLSAITSCKKNEGTFYGTYTGTRPFSPDTVFLTFSDNSNFRLGTGSNNVEQGSGTYTYTSSQIIFSFTSGAPGVCAGTPGVYTYIFSNGYPLAKGLLIQVESDDCNDGTIPREWLIGGDWQK